MYQVMRLKEYFRAKLRSTLNYHTQYTWTYFFREWGAIKVIESGKKLPCWPPLHLAKLVYGNSCEGWKAVHRTKKILWRSLCSQAILWSPHGGFTVVCWASSKDPVVSTTSQLRVLSWWEYLHHGNEWAIQIGLWLFFGFWQLFVKQFLEYH